MLNRFKKWTMCLECDIIQYRIIRGYVEEYLQNRIKRFNNANPENPIRKFEPHICRHTFTTNMQYLPPKTLQYILGHGNISTIMYNEM